MKRALTAVTAGTLLFLAANSAGAQTLRGSTVAMQRQNLVAQQHDYSFLRTSSEVRKFVDSGYLVHLPGNASYGLSGVSHPYARPALKLFIERLSSQYRTACGEKLVVTSLTRPVKEQPRNASDLSVHPAGMAVDLRVSGRATCRQWLERTLLALERQGVLDATRESRPPHYHVALFPASYTKYIARLSGPASMDRPGEPASVKAVQSTVATASGPRLVGGDGPAVATGDNQTYRVNRGDSLWSIARRLGTSVEELKQMNNLKSAQIVAGQVLAVPSVVNGAESSTQEGSDAR